MDAPAGQVSSIYSDLRKYAGPIKAMKITADENLPEDLSDMAEIKIKQPPKRGRRPAANASGNINVTNSMLSNVLSSTLSDAQTNAVDAAPSAENIADVRTKSAKSRRKNTPSGEVANNNTIYNAIHTAAPSAENTSITIDDIAAMLPAMFTPLRDQTGYVHDGSTLGAKCPRGHIHKYYLKDIIGGGPSKCVTCSTGNKFVVTVRETAESIIGLPFVLAEKKSLADINAVEFINPVTKLIIACVKTPGMNGLCDVEGYTVLKIHSTTSAKKIKSALCEHLANYPLFTSEQREKLAAGLPKATNMKKIYPKTPLPFTPELAAVYTADAENPLLARMMLNVVCADDLCLENC